MQCSGKKKMKEQDSYSIPIWSTETC